MKNGREGWLTCEQHLTGMRECERRKANQTVSPCRPTVELMGRRRETRLARDREGQRCERRWPFAVFVVVC